MGTEEEFPLPRNFGPYQLTRLIGAGGMARVYEARLSGLHGFEKRLAIKMMLPEYAGDKEFVTMLIDEAKIAVALNHSNICQVHDLGCIENRYFIAMEYVDGADLNKVVNSSLKRRYPIPYDVVAQIGQDVCAGLDYAHAKVDNKSKPLNIIHRDISPANILISMSGEVKIVDFGVAKAASRSQQTTVGVVKGKYQYMSPEQVTGSKIDHRSDIFAVGIVLYETVAGRMLYPDGPDMLDRVRLAKRKPLSQIRPDIPKDLDAIISKALKRKPKDRYQNAGEMGEALAEFRLIYQTQQGRGRLDELMAKLFGKSSREKRSLKRRGPKAGNRPAPSPPEETAKSIKLPDFEKPEESIPEILDQPPNVAETPPPARRTPRPRRTKSSKKKEKVLHIHGKVIQINEAPPDIREQPPRPTPPPGQLRAPPVNTPPPSSAVEWDSPPAQQPSPAEGAAQPEWGQAPELHAPTINGLNWGAQEDATLPTSHRASSPEASVEASQGHHDIQALSLPQVGEDALPADLDLARFDEDMTTSSHVAPINPPLVHVDEETLSYAPSQDGGTASTAEEDPDLETSTDTFSVPHDIYEYALSQASPPESDSPIEVVPRIVQPISEVTLEFDQKEQSQEQAISEGEDDADVELDIDVDLSFIGTSKGHTTTGYFLIRNPEGMTSGPFSRAQLSELARKGKVTPQDLAAPTNDGSIPKPIEGAVWAPLGLFIADSDTEFEAQIALQLPQAVQTFDLTIENVAKLFLQMAAKRRHGVLVFDRPGVHKEVTFAQGHPTYASSNISDEQLGKRLLRQGLLSPADLTSALQQALKERRTLSEVVVQLEMVRLPSVNNSLERLVRARLIELFEWGSGSATLHPGSVDAAPLDLMVEPISLIKEGIEHSASPYGPAGWLVRKESETLILTGESPKPLQFFDVTPGTLNFLERFRTPLGVKEVIQLIGTEDLEKEDIAWGLLVAYRLGCLAAVAE